MKVEHILLKYQEKGVTFNLNGEKLGFSAPKGIIDDKARNEIKEYKDAIIKYLKSHNSNVIIDKDSIYQAFNLTDIQSSYLVGRNELYQYGGIGCKIYFEYEFPKMERNQLEKAWKKVVDNNDMLHAVVNQNGTQQILEEYEVPHIKEWNMESASKEEMEPYRNSIRERMIKKQYEPGEYPLYDLEITSLINTTILHVSLDMLIADFTSMNIIISELQKYYYDNPVIKKELSFRDVIIYDENTKNHPKNIEKIMEDEYYWKDRIPSLPESPELPIIEENGGVSICQYNTYMNPERVNELKSITDKYKVTLSGIILSIYAETLSYWSKQKEFCINVTMANRPGIHPEIHSVVGDFTVVDILEISALQDEEFGKRMQNVQKQLWEDLEHLSYTGIDVLREMTKRNKKEVIIPFVYTSTLGLHADSSEPDKGCGKLIYKISQTPQVLIDCQVIEYKGGILVNWDVRENVFPADLIETAFHTFSELLTTMEIGMLIKSKSPVTLPDKMKKVRKKVNSVSCDFKDWTLHRGFYENVRLHPDAEALFCDGVSYSYKDVGEFAVTIQKELQNRGCSKGDIVAIELDKGIWQIASVLGVLFAGAAYLPIDINQPRVRKNNIIADAKAKYTVNTSLVDNLVIEKGADIDPVTIETEQTAYIIYTSGSTGNPKGVAISHRAAMNTVQDIIKKYNITKDDKGIGISNLSFDLSVFDIFGLLTAGGSIILPSSENSVTEWNQLLIKKQVTIWNTVPAQMQMLISYLRAEHLVGVDRLRLVLLSGDYIPVKLPNEIHNTFVNSKIISLGGATEASIWSIAYEIDPDHLYERSIPYGTPLTNQEFYILDSNMQECPDWVKGSLYISGKGLAKEYLGDKELSAKKFFYHKGLEKRLYSTGDYGRYYPDGVIEFLGRKDYQVKVRGHRVELGEIEAIINSHHDVESSVVVSAPHNSDMLGAFIQPCFELESKNMAIENKLMNINKEASKEGGLFETNFNDYEKWLKASNQTALLDIIKTFLSVGVFSNCNKWYSLQEVYKRTGAHENFQPLIRRWLSAIKKEGYIIADDKQNYKTDDCFDPEAADKEWEKWAELDESVHYSNVMMQYFKTSRKNLIPLLRGELDPVDLFFPQGKFDVALAAYKNNIVSKCMNKVTMKAIVSIADAFRKKYPKKKFNILEVGAGVGGVSIDLIEALKDYSIRYLFTDISHSFLNEAQIQFGKYPWVEYGLYDINKDYWNQDISASSFDVILCNNVLHNANDEQCVLKQFKEMVTPNGYVVILDATGTNYTLLTSMEFHSGLNGVEDFRLENDQVFLNKPQWLSVFEKVGVQLITMFPAIGHPLEILGQTLFVTQFSSERRRLESDKMEEYLKCNVPDYMVPAYIEIMSEFPLTINGKIDRNVLQERIVKDNKTIASGGKEPKTDLEKAVAEIWKKALKKDTIWCDENFYEAGGDSLLVAQVVAKMKEDIPEAGSWEWDKLMVALGEAPTVEGICKKLISHKNSDKNSKFDPPNCLIVLKDDLECKTTRVLVHDGTGTISPYNLVIPYLKEESGSLLAVVCNDKDEYLSFGAGELIQRLGEKYANVLINSGKTDFELLGYCMGGLIAIEIAKVLLESGVKVRQVISIDTTPSRKMLDNELFMERAFGMIIGADIIKAGHTVSDQLLKKAIHELSEKFNSSVSNEEIINLNGRYLPVGECYKKMVTHSHKERLHELYDTLSESEKNIIGYQRLHLDALYQVFCHSFRAVISYNAGVFMGDVKVLSCENKDASFLPVEATDNEQFWRSAVLGNIEWKKIKGTHLTCMSKAYAKNISELLLKGAYDG